MSTIYLERVQTAAERLSEQISVLREMRDELNQARLRIQEMAFTQQTVVMLEQSGKELEEEIVTLQRMKECLDEIVRIYEKTEARITDVYDMEQICYPRTDFRVSRIMGLERYVSLMPFRMEDRRRE